MGIARKWVFPILRLIVFAAIAAALVKLAFFATTEETASPELPTGQIVEPQLAVARGTISNDIVLEGSVVPAPPVAIVPSLTGEVRSLSVENGDRVEKGDELAQIRALVVNPDGSPGGTRWLVLEAPASGVVSGLGLFIGETVSAGQEAGSVTPGSFRVTAPLPPEQQYRLVDEPEEAEVAINGGPAPFTCTGLRIVTPTAEGGEEGGAQTTVRCTVPGEVRVFAGLTARVTIAGGIAEDVLTVPMTAVLGAAESGVVYAVLPDGSTEERPVTLGINDGVLIEIVEGLEEGDTILEFVPGAPADGGIDGGGILLPGGGPVVIDEGTGEIIGQGG